MRAATTARLSSTFTVNGFLTTKGAKNFSSSCAMWARFFTQTKNASCISWFRKSSCASWFIQPQVALRRFAFRQYRSPPAPLRPRRASPQPWTRSGSEARRAARRPCASGQLLRAAPVRVRCRASRAAPQRLAILQPLSFAPPLSVRPQPAVVRQRAAPSRHAVLGRRAGAVRECAAGWRPLHPPPRRSTLPSGDLRRCLLQPQPAPRAVLPPFVSWWPPARPVREQRGAPRLSALPPRPSPLAVPRRPARQRPRAAPAQPPAAVRRSSLPRPVAAQQSSRPRRVAARQFSRPRRVADRPPWPRRRQRSRRRRRVSVPPPWFPRRLLPRAALRRCVIRSLPARPARRRAAE